MSRAEGCLVWEGRRWGQCGQAEWWRWLREGPGEQGWGRCQREAPLEGWGEGVAYAMWEVRGSFRSSCREDRLQGPLAALHWQRCRSHHTRLCSCLNTYLLIPSHSVADKSLAEVEQPTLPFLFSCVSVTSKAECTCDDHFRLSLLTHYRAARTIFFFDCDG